jgi:hypothetical protein
MHHTQLEAVRDVQADILSTLKEASYFTNDTTRAHINSLHIDSFNKLKYRVKKMKVRCSSSTLHSTFCVVKYRYLYLV